MHDEMVTSPSGPGPLRIALVSSRYAPWVGAVESQVRGLAHSLVAAGHHVTVLTHDLDDSVPEREEIDGVTVLRFQPLVPGHHHLPSPALARHLESADERYDVVHAHGDQASPAAAVARAWSGPFVYSPHLLDGGPSPLRTVLPAALRAAERRIIDRADIVVCASEAERRLLARRHPGVPGRIAVVPASSPDAEVTELYRALLAVTAWRLPVSA